MNSLKIIKPELEPFSYDEDFFEDMLGLFPDASGYAPTAGGVGKYMYDGHNWNDVIKHSKNYYVPRGECELIKQALAKTNEWGVPNQTPLIDFGVGGKASFLKYVQPIMRGIQSREYIGVDFCERALDEMSALQQAVKDEIQIKTEKLDFFFPTSKVLSLKKSALGVMNGLTLGNLHTVARGTNIKTNLVAVLQYLSQLCGHGWLLLTIDTNQDEEILRTAYNTEGLKQLFLSVFSRMARELPVENFDPSLFVYAPEFKHGFQLWAHIAKATSTQNFKLGPYSIHINKNQKIHLLNSYKWRREFFESCCEGANLSMIKHWTHETGMMLYLLKDKSCLA